MRNYLLNNREKESNLKYDFLPSLIEIVEKPANRWGSVVIIISLFLFLSAGLWAALSWFDIVISAEGIIMCENEINVVETAVSGQVIEVMAEEGGYVEKGDIILCLDTSKVEDTLEELNRQLAVLYVQQQLYEKIENGEDITQLDVNSYGEEMWTAKAIVEQEKAYRLNLKEYERQKETGEDSEYADYQKKIYEQNYHASITQELVQCTVQINKYLQEKEEYERILESYTIKSTSAGYITDMQVHFPGEVLSQGDRVAGIVDKENLVFECYVSDTDIADVEIGQKVQLKIGAYPYSEYGMLEGCVLDKEDISIQKEGYKNVYVVKVLLPDTQSIQFCIGMSGTAEIVVGSRSALDYFLDPVTEVLRESFREK